MLSSEPLTVGIIGLGQIAHGYDDPWLPSTALSFSSEPASGYSLDNLAPSVPDSMFAQAGYDNGIVVNLEWSESIDGDFQFFSIYRDMELVIYSTTNFYVDEVANGNNQVSYQVTATDVHGNESQMSTSINVELAIQQTIQSGLGWNWFSYNVDPEDSSLDAILSSVSDNAIFITSQSSGTATYYEDYGWYGSLEALEQTEMYKLKVLSLIHI